MKEMVLSPEWNEERVELPYKVIRRDYYSNVFTLSMDKIYRPIFMKGWIDRRLRVWPHGYIPDEKLKHVARTAMTRTEWYMIQKI